MPLVTPSDPADLGPPAALPAPAPAPAAPGALDVAAAAARTGNLGGSLYDYFAAKNNMAETKPVKGFDSLASIPVGYEDHADAFIDSQSPAENAFITNRIDREREDNQTIQRAGGWGTASVFAFGATDPLTLASMAIPFAGEARLANAARLGMVNAGTTALQEGVMHEIDPTRTDRESAVNIGAGAVLGGVLGAAISPHVPVRTFEKMRTDLGPELQPSGGSAAIPSKVLGPTQRMVVDTALPSDLHPDVQAALDAMRGPKREPVSTEPMTAEPKGGVAPATGEVTAKRSPLETEPEPFYAEPVTSELHVNPEMESTAGAAATRQDTLEAKSIARGARTLAEGPIGQVTPGLGGMTSPSLEMRKVTQQLVNIPEMTEENYRGVASPSPVERELWHYDGINNSAMAARAEQFRTYRERVSNTGEKPLSRDEFGEQVSHAMRNSDQHELPEVAKAASETRRIAFEPLKVRAQKLGLLPPSLDVKGADSYLMRQYSARKINGDMNGWLDRLQEGFKEQGVEPAEAAQIAHEANRNIGGAERGTMDWKAMDGIVPKSGRLKDRTLDLKDNYLEPYLNNNIDELTHSYLRSLAPEVEMTERFGSRNLVDQRQAITDEYARLMEQAKARGEDSNVLYKRMKADLKDLEGMRDRLYGTLGQPKDPGAFFVRAGRTLRSVNAGRLLGAATLAHFPDLANVIMRYGMPQTFGAIGKIITSGPAMNLTRSEAKRMGAALDMTQNVTASLLGDYGNHSQFAEQRFMNKATRAFTIMTGETPLITSVQALTSTIASDTLLRAAEKVAAGSKLGVNQGARLAAAGIDNDMLARIAEQASPHMQQVNGLRFGMSDKWEDQSVARVFESAVLRDAHGVTLRPGAGDTPLLMSSEWGKTIFQFKSFGFAANRTVVNPLLQGLAHGDINAAQGLLALAFMGTASYVAKQKAAGQPIEDPTSGKFALEVLDKSNLLGWTGDAIFPLLWQTGHKNLSRWSDRDPYETFLGPTIGTLGSLWDKRLPSKLGGAIPEEGQPGLSRGDLHFMRRMMPGQNLWYLRNGVNTLEDSMGDLMNLPGKSNADRAEQYSQVAQQ